MSAINGGGTPIQALLSDGQQQQVPQQQPPQMTSQQQQMLQQMNPQEQQMIYEQMRQQMIPQQEKPLKSALKRKKEHLKNNVDESTTAEKFKNATGTTWYKFLIVIILFIIFGNSWIYDCEKNLLPIGMRMGNPPLILVILNGLIVGLIYLLICKIVPE